MFEWITQIDYEILVFIQEHLRFDWLTEPLVFISHLGNAGLFWIVLCLSLLISRRTRKMGVCGLLALLISALITNVALKNIVARIRPYEQFADLKLLLERQSDFSFPSGHSSSSFAAACALYWASDRRIRKNHRDFYRSVGGDRLVPAVCGRSFPDGCHLRGSDRNSERLAGI